MFATRCSLLARRHISSRFFTSPVRPFQILGLQQIAVGALTKEPLTELWQDIFGLIKVKTFVSESENVDEDILMLGDKHHAVEVDLMTPVDAEKSPKVHSPALNHIGLWVDDLELAVSWMQDKVNSTLAVTTPLLQQAFALLQEVFDPEPRVIMLPLYIPRETRRHRLAAREF